MLANRRHVTRIEDVDVADRRRRCPCGDRGETLCDWKLVEPKRRGVTLQLTCDRAVCVRCRVEVTPGFWCGWHGRFARNLDAIAAMGRRSWRPGWLR